MKNTKKYYYINSQRVTSGPHDASELLQLHEAGEIQATTKIAQKGGQTWLAFQHCQADLLKIHQEVMAANRAAMRYHVLDKATHEISGPFYIEELEKMINSGHAPSAWYVCKKGDKTWQALSDAFNVTGDMPAPAEATRAVVPYTEPAKRPRPAAPEAPQYEIERRRQGITPQPAAPTKRPTSSQPIATTSGRTYSVFQRRDLLSEYDFGMGFFATYWFCISHCTDFTRRAVRQEYWRMWFVMTFLIPIFSVMLLALFAIFVSLDLSVVLAAVAVPFLVIYGLLSFITSLACMVRRLHDTGHSGFFILLFFIPLGNIYLFILLLSDSTPGTNTFGISQKYPD